MNSARTMTAAIAALMLTLAVAQARQARDQMQAPRTGTALISGVVMSDEQTPQPLKRAQVMVLNAETAFTKNVVTNDAGRFSITGLPAGRYTLTASKTPYLRVAYGARRYDRPGTPITLKDGQQLTDVSMRLPRGGVLSGTITDENGQPAFGVSVRPMQLRVQGGERTFVSVASGNPFGEVTDDRGAYRFFGLPPGDYAIVATPRAFAGEVRAMTDAEIRGVMQALQQQQQTAAAQQSNMPGVARPPAQTQQQPKNDADAVMVGYSNVYYPGTTVASMASTVPVAVGEERSGVDFALKLVRTAKIEGTVSVPSGIRPQNVQLMLMPAQAGTLDQVSFNRAAPDSDGKFAFTAVPPGQYTITARASAPPPGAPPPPPPPPPPMAGAARVTGEVRVQMNGVGAGDAAPMMVMPGMMDGGGGGPVYWGQADLSVDGTSISGVTVPLQPGMTVAGKVTFKGTRLVPDADLTRVNLILTPVQTPGVTRITMGVPMAQVSADGQFRITGVTPGRYRISGMAPLPPGSAPGPGWSLSSAVVKGRDVLDFPIDIAPNDEINDAVITFSDSTQEVNGSLQDATGRPAPDYTIVVFAADNRFWTTPTRRVKTTRPGTDGRFTVSNLPPGDYRIAALTDVAPGDINEASFLEQLVGASVKFTLAEGEKKTQDLRIAGGL